MVAQRVDCDDVLFALNNIKNEYVVVHLTWKMGTERNPEWPAVSIYESYEAWKRQCIIPDHLECACSFNEFTVEQANRRLTNEIALYGTMTKSIKPGDYLCLDTDWSKNFKVKGIEAIGFIEKPKNALNPWVIIQTNTTQPDDFIGKKYLIVDFSE